ncbi:MAG: flagellar M-ring protein FliF, partial [Deltaproteobacteria bacterium]|nr:flagellar M-ring protein FliF [Deltaproteobacteria bacterium]
DLRFELAAEGVPQSTGIGYEIFDRQSLGVTEFVQKVNFQRALQGELARTITQLEEVKLARVHVTIPKETLFVDEQQKPQASVVLSLESGKMLRDSQIQGITHLVASSVEGMDPDEVIIVDSHGKLISGGQQRLEQVGITSSQQQLQSVTENNLARKIESMLGNVVGHDKVTAKVSVDLNFTQIEQTEESYDPEAAAVRSEQRGSEKSSGRRPIASGIPGVVSNVPETQQSAAAAGVKSVDYNKQDETVNYEISKVIKRTVNQIGAVSRLTVAVLIDGTYVTATDKEGIETSQYTVRSPEEMNKYAALVKQAVGYNEDRGDTVEVVNVQFQEMDLETKSIVGKLVEQIDLQSIITYMITAFLFALFFIFGLR